MGGENYFPPHSATLERFEGVDVEATEGRQKRPGTSGY